MGFNKKNLDIFLREVKRANRRSRYYAKKGKDVLPNIKPSDILDKLSNNVELNRYIKVLKAYNEGSFAEWDKRVLKITREYAKRDAKKKQKKPPKISGGYTYLGSDTLKEGFAAELKKYPKKAQSTKTGKGEYIFKHLYRGTKQYNKERLAIFKRNYMQIMSEQLGAYADNALSLIAQIANDVWYDFYIEYQHILDISFVYSASDSAKKAREIERLIKDHQNKLIPDK